MPEPRRLIAPNAAVASVGNVMIAYWPVRVTQEAVDAVLRQVRLMMSDYPAGIGYLVILDPRAPLPDDKARTRIPEFLSVPGDRLLHAAIVIEGSGFAASAFRALVSSVLLVRRGPTRVKVFSDAMSAASWLEENAHGSGTASSLASELDRLRTDWSAAHAAR